MKLIQYIRNNLTQKKVRTILVVIGISMSLVSTIVMALMTDYYSDISTDFFLPFEDYNQVLERGTNFIQLLPTGSNIDLDIKDELDEHFGVESIPMLILSNSEDLISFYNNYIFGIPFGQMPRLFQRIHLQEGRWPQESQEVIVGDNLKNATEVIVMNQTFNIVGVLNTRFSYLDRIILLDHTELEQLSGKHNRTTILFIPKDVENTPDLITTFENQFEAIDIMTSEEFDELRGEIGVYMDNMVNVLSVFTSTSAIVFVFSLELLNILSRKKDFEILQILGTSQVSIFALVVLESILLLFLGIFIGIPASFFIYGILYSILITTVNSEATFFSSMAVGLQRISHPFPFEIFAKFILIIGIANIIFAFFIALLGLHKFNISHLKQKY
ncbi:MAG: ABC transporter permease [Promethearchaeota archaeon]